MGPSQQAQCDRIMCSHRPGAHKLLLSKASNQLATVLYEAPKLDEDEAGGKLSSSAIRRAPQASNMTG